MPCSAPAGRWWWSTTCGRGSPRVFPRASNWSSSTCWTPAASPRSSAGWTRSAWCTSRPRSRRPSRLRYAEQNVEGLVSLLAALRATGGTRVVFSSSCSVYGTPDVDLVNEDQPTAPVSPYGESKLYGERLLAASATAYNLGMVSLRYFNVVGAAAPDLADTGVYNLVPLVFRAIREDRPAQVFGGDYGTPDGTCIRDYVDVRDLALAHVRAAAALEAGPRVATYNVGRGEGNSV